MTPLAVKTNSINLGQGFPSWNPPDFYLKNFEEALKYSKNFIIKVHINMLVHMGLSITPKLSLNFINQTLDSLIMKTTFVWLMGVLKDFIVHLWD